MRLAFVVQRYGADIAGGSEAHCRQLAQHMGHRHDITVLTTCARDYVTWANAYPPGRSGDGNIQVVRFPVARQRNLAAFGELSDVVFDGGATSAQQEAWFRENGPDAPELLDHLRQHGRKYDLVLFWAYRYAPSYFGLPLVGERSVLVPTAEEDPAIDLTVLRELFSAAAGFLFLTPEEKTLVANRMDRLPPAAVIGTGLEPAAAGNSRREPLDALDIPTRYFLYLGRVDRNKGCDTLLDYFEEYSASDSDATLVLAGPAKMRVPAHPRLRSLGYVSDNVRASLLEHAEALIIPSPYESLSIVLLEGWNAGVPAVVNGRCKVLAGQVRRANGGLAYRSSAEFQEALHYLREHPAERQTFGEQGREYVDREYRWPLVVARVEALLAEVSSRLSESSVR